MARFRRFNADVFTEHCNQVFEEEKAAYRFVENWITPIINEKERATIRDAARSDEAGRHISRAITLYRDRSEPDYRNSVKESISAVEATYRRLTGGEHKNIGAAITALEGQGRIDLPTSLKKGFSQIYGWTSGRDGIRHALMKDAPEITEPEARLMLVMCSAYVNYLLSLRGSKTGRGISRSGMIVQRSSAYPKRTLPRLHRLCSRVHFRLEPAGADTGP